MSQDDKSEGCFRTHLKPGQELPELPSAEVLAKAILKDVDAGGPSVELDPSTAALMRRLMG